MQCMEVWGGNQSIDSGVSVPGIDAWVTSQPYENSPDGGDIYYVSLCGHGMISRFSLADVSGHGETVGQLGANLRALMHKHINTIDQTRFARSLNEEFGALASTGRFATALMTSYFAPQRRLIVVNAGHPAPLHYRKRTDTWDFLTHDSKQNITGASDLPLGVTAPTRYHPFAITLDPRDLVLIYTDWLLEARAPGGAMLGLDGLIELVRSLDPTSPDRFGRSLLDAVDDHRGHAEADDDQTILVLHHHGQGAPSA